MRNKYRIANTTRYGSRPGQNLKRRSKFFALYLPGCDAGLFVAWEGVQMPSATRRQFLKRVEQLGCTVTETEDSILVDAPDGTSFGCEPGLTCLVAPIGWSGSPKPEAYADLIERLSYGLEQVRSAD